MAKPVAHIGTRSWWSGQVRTLCGQRFDSGSDRVRFPRLSGYTICPACTAAQGRR